VVELLPFLIKAVRFNMVLHTKQLEKNTGNLHPQSSEEGYPLTLPNSFRPVCLLSFLLKTLEKMVYNYIRTEILERVN